MTNPVDERSEAASDVPARRPAGRPRREATKIKILQAANAILEEEGIGGFTVEAVAARAGAGKATIYRWWPTRGALAMAGFLAETEPKIAYSVADTARAELTLQLKRVAEVYSGTTGKVLAALIAEGQRDPGTIAAFVEGYARPRREEGKRILEAGIASGELRGDLDLEIALDALYGPIYYRLLVPLNPLDASAAQRIADHVFAGLMAAPHRAGGPRSTGDGRG